jgi:hypothetical protein
MQGKASISDMASELAGAFPTLHIETGDDGVSVCGSYIVEAEGLEIARYDIRIEIPEKSDAIPKVFEIGGKIPKVTDRHFNTRDRNSACLFVPDEQWKHYPNGSTLISFLQGPVRDFFLWQAHMDLTGKELFPARSHGADGILESYYEELGTKDPVVVRNLLEYLAHNKPKGNRICYCGSGRKLSDCHLGKLMELRRKIGRGAAQRSLKEVDKSIALSRRP